LFQNLGIPRITKILPAPAVITKPEKFPDLNSISSGAFVGQRFQVPAFEKGQITGSKGRGPSGREESLWMLWIGSIFSNLISFGA
jgi:hypothetical protein